MKKKSQYIRENILKNLLVIFIVIINLQYIKEKIYLVSDDNVEALLGLIGLLLVFSAATNYTFSYESVNFKKKTSRFLAHLTTFLAEIIMISLLVAIMYLVMFVYKPIAVFTLIIGIFSVATIILFDFWDFNKNKST